MVWIIILIEYNTLYVFLYWANLPVSSFFNQAIYLYYSIEFILAMNKDFAEVSSKCFIATLILITLILVLW